MKTRTRTTGFLRLLLCVIIILSLSPVNAALAADYVNDGNINSGYVNDDTQFPVYPKEGGLNLIKQAEWVGGSDEIAKITLSMVGSSVKIPIDVILVLDRTGSMGNGSNDTYSRCTNPAHYITFVYTKQLTYQVNATAGANATHAGWTTVTDTVTVTLRCHQRPGYTARVDTFSVSGYRVSMNGGAGGAPVALYRRSATDTATWPQSAWAQSNSGTINAALSALLLDATNGFGGMASDPAGFPFPTLAANLNPGRDMYNESSNGCTFRINDAKKAGFAFVDTIFAPHADGSDNMNRLGVIHFGQDSVTASATTGGAGHVNNLYPNTAANHAYLRDTFIGGMTVSGSTNYTIALRAAADILEARSPADKAGRPAYVVFMSDGEPNIDLGSDESMAPVSDGTGWTNITDARNRIEAAGATIYTVGLSITSNEGHEVLRKLSTGRSLYNRFYPVQDPAGLTDVFISIALQIKSMASQTVITDELSEYFDFIDASPYVPSVTRGSLDIISSPGANPKLTWNLGNVTEEEATLTYYVKIKSGVGIGTFPTNEEAYAEYYNYLDNSCRFYFEVPEITRLGASYNIEYYKDNLMPENHVGTTTMDSVLVGSTITIGPGTGSGQLDEYLSLLPGYRSGVQQGVVPYTIAYGENVIRVLYSRRTDIKYVVRYYKDEVSEANFLDKVEGAGVLGDAIPADLSKFAPEGYAIPGIRGGATVITAVEANNVVTVVYSKRGDIPYKIFYYKDSVSEGNFLGEDGGTGVFGAAINADLTLHAPAGYVVPGARGGATHITAVEANNVVNVVYSKRNDIPFIVHYYKDSVSEANYLGYIRGTGTLDAAIPASLSRYAPEGYAVPGARSGATHISAVEEENVVIVVYEKDRFSYSVVYYYDGIIDDLKTETYNDQLFGEIIKSYPSKKGVGYRLERDTTPLMIGAGVNVIKVYYVKIGDLRVNKYLFDVNGTLIDKDHELYPTYQKTPFTIRLTDNTGEETITTVVDITIEEPIFFPIQNKANVNEPGALILEEINLSEEFELMEVLDKDYWYWKDYVGADGLVSKCGETSVFNQIYGIPTLDYGSVKVSKYIVYKGRLYDDELIRNEFGGRFDKDFEIIMYAQGARTSCGIVIDAKSIADGIKWFIEGTATEPVEGACFARLTDPDGKERKYYPNVDMNISIDGLELNTPYTLELLLEVENGATRFYATDVLFDEFSLLNVSFEQYGQTYAEQNGGSGNPVTEPDADTDTDTDTDSDSDSDSDTDSDSGSGADLVADLAEILSYIRGGISGTESGEVVIEEDEYYSQFVTANDPNGILFERLNAKTYTIKEMLDEFADFKFYGMRFGLAGLTMTDMERVNGLEVEIDPQSHGYGLTVLNIYDQKERYSLKVKYFADTNTGTYEVSSLEKLIGDNPRRDEFSYVYEAIIFYNTIGYMFKRAEIVINEIPYSLSGIEAIDVNGIIYIIDEEGRVISGSFANGDVELRLYYFRPQYDDSNDYVPEPDPVITIPEIPAPLAPLPKPLEIVEVVEEEVPLGNLPRTGAGGISGIGLLVVGLFGTCDLLFGKRKKDED